MAARAKAPAREIGNEGLGAILPATLAFTPGTRLALRPFDGSTGSPSPRAWLRGESLRVVPSPVEGRARRDRISSTRGRGLEGSTTRWSGSQDPAFAR